MHDAYGSTSTQYAVREGVAADGVEACLGRHGKIAIFLTPAVARITSPTREKEGVAAERTGST
jgi:hypothetical protein